MTYRPDRRAAAYRLQVLGGIRLEGPDGPLTGRAVHRRQLALLAVLATAGERGVTREKLLGLLWGDIPEAKARRQLSDALYAIRLELGEETVVAASGGLEVDRARLWSDIAEFDEAIAEGNDVAAAGVYRGPFLDGFSLDGVTAFEEWSAGQQRRCSVAYAGALERLACAAEGAGDPASAVAWWEQAAQHDPYNSRVAMALARSLAAVGDRGNGILALREHAARLHRELGVEVDPEILAAIDTGDVGIGGDHANGHPHVTAGPRAPTAKRRHAVDAESPHADEGNAPRASLPVPPEHRRTGASRSRRRRVLSVASAAVLLVVAAYAVRAGISDGTYDPTRFAILPSRVTAMDTSMSTRLTSHLQSAMARWGGLSVTGPTATERLWREAGGSARAGVSDLVARAIARQLGAGLVLTTDAVPSKGGIDVDGWLVDAGDGTVLATASVTVSPDSIGSFADVLLFHLIARVQRVPEERIGTLEAYDPDAVRSYLEAHRLGAPERDRLLREALAHDSTFVLAALDLLETAADYYDQHIGDAWESIAAIAWNHRERLSPADRAYVEALVGWRFLPDYSAAQHVAAWERAVEIAPDRLQHLRGLALECYRWCSELSPGWKERVLEAQDALLDAGDADPDVLERGLEVAFLAADRVRMRRYAGLLPDSALYGRWLAAWGLNARSDVAELRRLIEEGEFNDLRVGNVAVLTGLGLEDAGILARRDKNSGRIHQLRALVQARERGHHAEYRALRQKMFQLGHTTAKYHVFQSHDVVWDWAYFDEPETVSVLDRHDRTLVDIVGRQPTAGPDTLATAYCALAQLRLGRGDTTGVTEAIEFLSNDPAARDLAVSHMCAPFLELLAARGRGHDVVTQAARRLNDVVTARPLDLGTGDAMINVEIMLAGAANLELARTYLALGYPEAGLRAVVRRPYRAGLWGLFGYHADFLLEEARLLAASGATDAALEKYDLYFRLRPDPPDLASWRETWNAAQAERKTVRAAVGG